MEKKEYEKPSLEVVELRQQTSLLQSSVFTDEVNATIDGVFLEEDI